MYLTLACSNRGITTGVIERDVVFRCIEEKYGLRGPQG